MELIYSLNDTQAADIAISGGKGASLAKTIQALPVPDGLILSCEAYKQFISLYLDKLVHSLLNTLTMNKMPANLSDNSYSRRHCLIA